MRLLFSCDFSIVGYDFVMCVKSVWIFCVWRHNNRAITNCSVAPYEGDGPMASFYIAIELPLLVRTSQSPPQ